MVVCALVVAAMISTAQFGVAWGNLVKSHSVFSSNKFGELRQTDRTYRLNRSHVNVETSPPLDALRGVTQVAVGTNFACALLISKTVDCWGDDTEGEIGNGMMSVEGTGQGYPDFPTPVPVAGLANVVQISAGTDEACAVLEGGTVDCWGVVSQFNDGPSYTGTDTPTPLSGISGIQQIAVGGGYVCAIAGGGGVECWGQNSVDQLGSGEPESSTSPLAVPNIENAIQLTAGEFNACALIAGGSIKCWGQNYSGELGDGVSGQEYSGVVSVKGITDATQIATGNGTSCATLRGGAVKCWGLNETGELDISTSSTSHASAPVTLSGLSGVKQVNVGQTNACALQLKGTVECWGDNNLRGNDFWVDAVLSYYPNVYRISNLTGVASISTAIASGTSQYSCALLKNASLECWGINNEGELGNGETGSVGTPSGVDQLKSVAEVSTGGATTCALLNQGTVDCWGLNLFGELGIGVGPDRDRPVAVPGISGVSQISVGQLDTCALLRQGTVHCWGLDAQGELGGGIASTTGPILVKSLTGVGQISVGWSHTCAVLDAGTVKCWGDDSWGQLGNGKNNLSDTPEYVTGLANVRQVASGDEFSCALLVDGSVKCWGNGTSGQLGDGKYVTYSLTPVSVQGLTGVSQISVGQDFACALLGTGAVECWGDDFQDELGNFENSDAGDSSSVPIPATQLSNVTSLSLGGETACAVTTSPTLECWGFVSTIDQASGGIVANWSPFTFADVSSVKQVSVGVASACVLRSAGTVECWGNDYDGQDGVGVLGYSNNPVWVTSPSD